MEKSEVRFAFVEMLFALAIAEVAIALSHLVSIDRPWELKTPAIAHLVLAMLLISTSWLGWSTSRWRKDTVEKAKAAKPEEIFNSPFASDFVGLLLDVSLVVIYFIIVRSVEISEKEPFELVLPSALPESRWIFWVFTIYVVWDIFSDVINEPLRKDQSQNISVTEYAKLSISCAVCSLFCMCLVLIVWWRAEAVSKLEHAWIYSSVGANGLATVFLDCALACVVLLFRAIKFLVEGALHRQVASLRRFDAFKKQRKGHHGEEVWSFGLVCLFVAFIALTWLPQS